MSYSFILENASLCSVMEKIDNPWLKKYTATYFVIKFAVVLICRHRSVARVSCERVCCSLTYVSGMKPTARSTACLRAASRKNSSLAAASAQLLSMQKDLLHDVPMRM